MIFIKLIKIYTSLILLDLELRKKKFHGLLPSFVKRYKLNESERINLTGEEIGESIYKTISLVDKACSLYPFEAKCLHRSFLAFKYLRKDYGIPVELIIGVTKFPFSAHAWLDYQGQSINESPDQIARFKVILRTHDESR